MKSSKDDQTIDDIFNKSPKELDKEIKAGMKEFHDLLNSLSTLHDKKKALWRQIYENSVMDRRNAYIMFTDLYQRVHTLPTEHAIHGATLAKYMERLNKSNEQLIRLAEILEDAGAESEDGLMDHGNMYDRLEKLQQQQEPKKSSEDKEDDDNSD
jgi:hypothetical protein